MDGQNNRQNRTLKDLKAFLFDLDGTLINSADDIVEAVNYTLKQLGKQPLPKDEIVKHVGYGGRKLMEDVLQTTDKDLIDKATEIFREYYFSNPCVYTIPYPYVEDLLEILKKRNKKIAVITNKYENISKKILDKLGLAKYIDVIVGSDTVGEKKPSPEPIFYALKYVNTSPNNSILIGDSEVDIQAGKNAGSLTGLVLYGYGKINLAKELNPDYIFKSLKEVVEEIK